MTPKRRRATNLAFRVREAPAWREHAANLEAEMLRRGMFFEIIDWTGDQGQLPL
jgi:hypothetical protein